MQIQIEDFGGGLPLPNYGSRRPSADYFNSNIMLHNFVVADLTSGENNVFVYDERAQVRGLMLCAISVCFNTFGFGSSTGKLAPENTHTLLLILDNCVGQNKSRVVFMFYAMLSIVFYKKVLLLFLLPGHSHNSADRVVGWCKRNLKGKNLYDPGEVVAQMNTTPAIKAEFMDHRTGTGPFFVGWKALLSKYFKSMPDGYTANYLYEIDAGVVTTRHLVTTADQDVDTFSIIGNGDAESIRKALLGDLFGSEDDLGMVTMENVQLARQAPLSLTTKKVKSLSLNYFSIPPQYLAFYPVDPATTPEPNETTSGSEQTNSNDETTGSKRKVAVGVPSQSNKMSWSSAQAATPHHQEPVDTNFSSPVKTASKECAPAATLE
ncbi:hypothetical protein PR001_g12026 [Phytophthora rubi]|uniref:DUF7869 domain-containing protein n=1 Tax=Phytophthora rubi TaxID=129364 RepID=A0A6A3MBD9_9STRA|nr:hypothetical protein PR001_g12026 [Phytophthora rubi]